MVEALTKAKTNIQYCYRKSSTHARVIFQNTYAWKQQKLYTIKTEEESKKKRVQVEKSEGEKK